MMNNRFYGLLLAGTFLSTSALAAEYEPTLDKLYAEGKSPIQSAFTLTETTETTGDDIYNIPDYDETTQTLTNHYYKLKIKDGVTSQTRLVNHADISANDLTGYWFDLNYTPSSYNDGGAAIKNTGIIGNIYGDFINNSAAATGYNTFGGAIQNDYGTIGNIYGNFIGNSTGTNGGAIYNYEGTIGDIHGDFIGNSATRAGGAIYNEGGTIGDIHGNFIGNSATASGNLAMTRGGAIFNDGNSTIGNIYGDFIGNSATSTNYSTFGGAIFNWGTIGDIYGDFIGNSTTGIDEVYSGAISSSGAIGNIYGDFIGNSATGNNYTRGGAIANYGTIGNIYGDFIGNSVTSSNSTSSIFSQGGAIFNRGTITLVNSIFKDNYVKVPKYITALERMLNGKTPEEYVQQRGYQTVAEFLDNQTLAGYTSAEAMAQDYGYSSIAEMIQSEGYSSLDEMIQDWYGVSTDEAFTPLYSSFEQYANAGYFPNAAGGAIYNINSSTINIKAQDGGVSLFSGNYVADEQGYKDYQAIHMSSDDPSYTSTLNLYAKTKGSIVFDDKIEGNGRYALNIYGDGDEKSFVKFNNEVSGADTVTLYNGSVTHLGLNGKISTKNLKTGDSNGVEPFAANNPILKVDVKLKDDKSGYDAGSINVSNDLEGDYSVIVNALTPETLQDLDLARTPFLFAPNDDTATASSFDVARVIGSPYLWDSEIVNDPTNGTTWYINQTLKDNPNYNPEPEPTPTPEPVKPVAPEVMAGIGLHEAAIEQTRSVVHNVRSKVSAEREYCPNCGIYDYAWNGSNLRNVWVLAQGESANIDKPADIDAKIWGIEAGFDLQSDVNNTFGVFASYRNGEYDLNGKGSKYHSTIGSDIEIDSWLAGLYYRYDKNMNWLFATLYGGIQQADVKTDDGIAKFDTDGIEFGASVEVGHTFVLANSLTLDPSLGIYYTQVNFDDANDNVSKEYSWNDIKHLEAELGAKLTKQFTDANVYVKPSVVQTLTDGDKVKITGLGKTDTYHDQTLGRIELGGRYGFTDALSAYAWTNYTFGSSYEAYALGAGLNYAW